MRVLSRIGARELTPEELDEAQGGQQCNGTFCKVGHLFQVDDCSQNQSLLQNTRKPGMSQDDEGILEFFLSEQYWANLFRPRCGLNS